MIINTIDEINKYLRANSTLQPESIIPFIPDAVEQFLKPYSGYQLLADVTALADDETPSDEFLELGEDIQNTLLWHCQAITARFAFFLAAPSLDLQITESGFAVISNNNLAPASKDRVQNFIASVEKLGWTSVEMFLKFLDEYKELLGDYAQAYVIPAYSDEYDLFINSALEFDRHFKIDKSRLLYQKIQPVIQMVEQLIIEPAISYELCDAIKLEISDNDITDRTRAILNLIRKAVAHYTAFEDPNQSFPLNKQVDKEKYKAIADKYLSQVKNYILAHQEDFPEYVSSSVYEDVTSRVNIYENTDTDKFYTFQ